MILVINSQNTYLSCFQVVLNVLQVFKLGSTRLEAAKEVWFGGFSDVFLFPNLNFNNFSKKI